MVFGCYWYRVFGKCNCWLMMAILITAYSLFNDGNHGWRWLEKIANTTCHGIRKHFSWAEPARHQQAVVVPSPSRRSTARDQCHSATVESRKACPRDGAKLYSSGCMLGLHGRARWDVMHHSHPNLNSLSVLLRNSNASPTAPSAEHHSQVSVFSCLSGHSYPSMRPCPTA